MSVVSQMKNRGVIMGMPRCVVLPSVMAGVMFVIVVFGLLFGVAMMALDGVMQSVHRDAGSDGFFGWYWMGWGVVVVVWWWLSSSSRRFRGRLKKLNGRVCLVCKRELDEGAERCGECGVVWSIDGLGKKWVKAAGVDR